MNQLTLFSDVRELAGVGGATADKLERLGIRSIRDLLFHIPFRYDDFSARSTIAKIQPKEKVSVVGEVSSVGSFNTSRHRQVIRAIVKDDTGSMSVLWFNQPYLRSLIKKGDTKLFSGTAGLYGKKITMTNPVMENISDEPSLHAGRLVPIYPVTAELTPRMLRSLVAKALAQIQLIPDELNIDILTKAALIPLDSALRTLHFPKSLQQVEQAHRRLAFGEIYSLLMEARERRNALQKRKVARKLVITAEHRRAFEHALPFELSRSQTQAMIDIALDLVRPHPTTRLLQGEVGSGKTILAAFSLYAAGANDARAALIAPTQIVATQHYEMLSPIFTKLGIRTALVMGGNEQKTDAPVVIGTHAILDRFKHERFAVVVFDEEHRFGVRQRDTFIAKRGSLPHVLTMTATPIPRTTAMTALADQEISYLELLPGREKKIKTKVVSETNRTKAYEWMKKKIETEHAQVFVVCPFIQQSSTESLETVKAAEQEFQKLTSVFSLQRLALVHGKTRPDQRDKILSSMRRGTIDILVSTPIIEVGIDIPNACIMLIEGAERFGLAQLHQLRGRIGRVGQPAYCFLFTSEGTPETTKRLKMLEQRTNGNELAELDLRLRGSGEFFGVRQHGWDTLRFAKWSDEELIQKCKAILKYSTISLRE